MVLIPILSSGIVIASRGFCASRTTSAAIVGGLVLLLAACAVRAGGDVTTVGMAVPFSTLAKGFVSGMHEPAQIVIRSQDEWVAVWGRHTRAHAQPPSAPPVDFSREMVVGIFMGQRGTGGYEIEITRVERADSQLRVYYRSKDPEPGAMVTQMLTQPYHVIKLPRDDGPLVVLREGPSR